MDKITPFLWFHDQAEEAANFYVSLFENSQIVNVSHWGEGAPAPKGSVMSATFRIDGREYVAFNGGPHFSLTPAFSLSVSCKTQKDIDRLWEKLLSDGGKESRCGWLTDRYGLSWQITPEGIGELIKHPKAMKAMMGMIKLDIAALQRAAAE